MSNAKNFRNLAIAANDGTLDEWEIELVAQMLELDDTERRFNERLRQVRRERPGDRRHFMRCREARKERAAITQALKRDLMLMWSPGGFFRDQQLFH